VEEVGLHVDLEAGRYTMEGLVEALAARCVEADEVRREEQEAS
jgi:hypothetical protein